MFDPEFQDAVDSIDMEYWLDREGVTYRKTSGSRGTQLNVRTCPFCGGGNWKVYMNAESGLGNCFHGDCQVKFNKVSFIRSVLNECSFGQVVEHIKTVAEEIGWRPMVKESKAQKDITKDIPFNMPTMFPIINYCNMRMKSPALDYLLKRGITANSINYFNLCDCVEGYFQYRKPDGEIGYQNYKNRIIIPIFDEDGKTVTFQGRDYSGETDKRYLFPPGLNATGTLFYNGWNAAGCSQIIIGEGVFDCIAIHQAIQADPAFKNVCAVASFGKHISMGDGTSQLGYLLRLKNKGLKVITFMWDGETRAILDAIEVALKLTKYGFKTRIALLSKDKDPNEIDPKELIRAFWEAKTITPQSAIALKTRFILK